jgi:hypothetical protein
MATERLNVSVIYEKKRLRRWRIGRLNTHTERHLTFGRLADERWWVQLSGQPLAWVYAYERDACDHIDRILAKGEWLPVPAEYGPDGMPADGGSWQPAGQTWKPGPAPNG